MRDRLLYDGTCHLCVEAARWVRALDPGGRVECVDFRTADLKAIDPRLSLEACETRIQLLERGGRLSEGFDAFRRLSLRLPLLWPAAPVMNFPGMRRVGVPVYDWVARLRFRLSSPR